MNSENGDLRALVAKVLENQEKQAEELAAVRRELAAAIEKRASEIVELLTNVKESLDREMHAGFARIDERFDAMQARLDRQGGILQSGVKWTARMSKWSEDIDRIIVDRDKRMDRLEARLLPLEGPGPYDDAL